MDGCLGSHGASLPPGSLRNSWCRPNLAASPEVDACSSEPPGYQGRQATMAGLTRPGKHTVPLGAQPRPQVAGTRKFQWCGDDTHTASGARKASGVANGCCGTSGPHDRRIPGTTGVWSSTITTSLTDATHCSLIYYRSCGTNQVSASAAAVTQGGYLARWLDARVPARSLITRVICGYRVLCGPDWAPC